MKLLADIPWRAWKGPLTDDLERVQGGFGLGQVPARWKPDATTGLICGFCATGCGLTAHLVDGEAVSVDLVDGADLVTVDSVLADGVDMVDGVLILSGVEDLVTVDGTLISQAFITLMVE